MSGMPTPCEMALRDLVESLDPQTPDQIDMACDAVAAQLDERYRWETTRFERDYGNGTRAVVYLRAQRDMWEGSYLVDGRRRFAPRSFPTVAEAMAWCDEQAERGA